MKGHYKKDNINSSKETNKFNYKLKFNQIGLYKIKMKSLYLVTFYAFFLEKFYLFNIFYHIIIMILIYYIYYKVLYLKNQKNFFY